MLLSKLWSPGFFKKATSTATVSAPAAERYADRIKCSRRSLILALESKLRQLCAYLELEDLSAELECGSKVQPTYPKSVALSGLQEAVGELGHDVFELSQHMKLFGDKDFAQLLVVIVNYRFFLNQRAKRYKASMRELQLISTLQITISYSDCYVSNKAPSPPSLVEQLAILARKIAKTDIDSPMLGVYYTKLLNVLMQILKAVKPAHPHGKFC